MMNFIKKHGFYVVSAVAILCLAYPTFASQDASSTASPAQAKQVVTATIDDALKLIMNPKTTSANKRASLKVLVEPFFDFTTITMLTVGKDYWPTLSADQKTSLSTAFEKYLLGFYLDKVLQFASQDVKYGEPIPSGKNRVHIPVTVTSGSRTYTMLYKLYYKDRWKAYDFEFEGVSIITTYHSQFEPFLKKKDIAGLIAQLK